MIKNMVSVVLIVCTVWSAPYVIAAEKEPKTRAESQDADSLVSLALRYRAGIGVEQSHEQANRLLEEAAKRGDSDAKFFLAGTYYRGLGVDRDYEKSRILLESIVQDDHSEGIFFLGYFYYQGLGVERDPEHARKLFEQAAKQGHIQSRFFLGVVYRDRLYDDYNNARYWFELSCADGLPKACNALQNLDALDNQKTDLEVLDILQ